MLKEPASVTLNMRTIQKTQFLILDPRDASPRVRTYLLKAYALWHEMWLATFKELDGATRLDSDGFTRQHAIGLLLENDEAIGCVSLSHVDLSEPMGRHDSCFATWPVETLASLGERYPGPKTLVASYFTLSVTARSQRLGYSAKELLAALVCQYFFDSGADSMVATVRNDRGMNDTCYKLNASPLNRGLLMHGVEVDLIQWDSREAYERRLDTPSFHDSRRIYLSGRSFVDELQAPRLVSQAS